MAAAAARALLDKNGDLTVEQYSAGLAKILGNILAHPAEEKYRRIKAKAKLVQQTILAADGGLYFDSMKPAKPGPATGDADVVAKLWVASERLTKVKLAI